MKGNAHYRACVHGNDFLGKSIFVQHTRFIFYTNRSRMLIQQCKSEKQNTHMYTHMCTHTDTRTREHTNTHHEPQDTETEAWLRSAG